MKLVKNIFFLYLLMFSILFAKQNTVNDIRLNTQLNEEKERIVIETSEETNFNTFTLNNPYRLVIDLQNTSLDVKAPSFKANKIVDTIRIGKFSEIDTRLVLNLHLKVKIINKFELKPNQNNKNHRIVIDLLFDKKDLEKEDFIGKLIADNHLYEVEENPINELIDGILASNDEKPIKNLAKYATYKQKRKPRIIIDAGHGGKDPGAVGRRKTKEKIITLIYAKSLKEALESTGKYKVYLTRSQDVFVKLRERVSIARRYKGDLFISIHADSARNKKARGLSIYTLSQRASDTRTAKLAQKENKADIIGGLNLYGEYQDTINTLVDISRRQAMNDSKQFAKILEKQLKRRNVNGLGTMTKHANFAVLTSADMPSILLELGFLSNKRDERMVRSFGYKTKMVNSLVSSINRYFKE